MPLLDRLSYKNTRPCDHSECSDIKTINRAIFYTEAFGYLCSDHGMLALIAGYKPIPLPEPPEELKIMMDIE